MSLKSRHLLLRCACVVTLCTGLFTTACTKIPELDKAVPDWVRTADYPDLIALDPSVTTITLPQNDAEDITQEMTARRDRLAQRAQRLKAPIVNSTAQARMEKGVAP